MLVKYALAVLVLFQFTLSVDVDIAVFNVTVLGDDGRPVTGLTEDKFRVFEDGHEEKIKIFQPEDTPATVGLLIDASGSMTHKRNDVIAAATAFIGASHPDDEMFIVNFNRKAWLGLPAGMAFTSDHEKLKATLMQTQNEGTTALYDAMEMALNHFKKEGARQRKAIVLLSDGGDNASQVKLEDVLRMAQQSSATIYCIGIYDPNQKDRNPAVLKRIAKVTGGESYFPNSLTELRTIWPRIADAIRGQYTIGYISSNQNHDGTFRKVKIIATGRRGKMLDVRTRPGYVSASGSN
jgi:Ca-activated chloride channel family protein